MTRVALVADIGFDGRVAADEWGSVIAPMVPLLREGRAEDAMIAGLDALDVLLASKDFAGGGGANELPDATVEIGEEPK